MVHTSYAGWVSIKMMRELEIFRFTMENRKTNLKEITIAKSTLYLVKEKTQIVLIYKENGSVQRL